MNITITDKHIDFTGSNKSYGHFPYIQSGLYTTNLMYYNFDTGELATLSFYCGPKGGYYFQFPNGTRKTYNYYDIDRFSPSGIVTIFRSGKLSEFLPKFVKYTTNYINTHANLLTRGQARLTHLQQLVSTYPEMLV